MRQESNVVSRISWCGDVGTSLRTARKESFHVIFIRLLGYFNEES